MTSLGCCMGTAVEAGDAVTPGATGTARVLSLGCEPQAELRSTIANTELRNMRTAYTQFHSVDTGLLDLRIDVVLFFENQELNSAIDRTDVSIFYPLDSNATCMSRFVENVESIIVQLLRCAEDKGGLGHAMSGRMLRVIVSVLCLFGCTRAASAEERVRISRGVGAGSIEIRGGLAKHYTGKWAGRLRWVTIENESWGLSFDTEVARLDANEPPSPQARERVHMSLGIPFHKTLLGNRYIRLNAIGGARYGRILASDYSVPRISFDREVCPSTMEVEVPGANTASVSAGIGAQLWLGKRYGSAFILWAEHRTDLMYAWLPGGGTTGRSHTVLFGIGGGSL